MTQRVVNYTYGTGNPVLPDGSIDVRDGIDNLQSLDVFMNAPEDTYNQRDGGIVSTIAGANNRFNAQILNMGFTRIGTFAAGATLTNPRQTLLWDVADGGDGQEYGWSGAFPKVVPAASTPTSTGGISIGAWISRFDPELRVQVREALRRSYAEAGYNLVDGSFEAGGTLVNSNDVLLQESTGKAFSGPAGTVAAGTNPASGGFVDRSGALLRPDVQVAIAQIETAIETAPRPWLARENVYGDAARIVITGDSLSYNYQDFDATARQTAFECWPGMNSWSFALRDAILRGDGFVHGDSLPYLSINMSDVGVNSALLNAAFTRPFNGRTRSFVGMDGSSIFFRIKNDTAPNGTMFMWFLNNPTNTACSFKYRVNGGPSVTIDTYSLTTDENRGYKLRAFDIDIPYGTVGTVELYDFVGTHPTPHPTDRAFELCGVGAKYVDVYQTGMGGQSSKWLADNVTSKIATYTPDYLIFTIGANDPWSGNPQGMQTTEQYRTNLRNIIDATRAANSLCEILLISQPHTDEAIYSNAVADQYVAVARDVAIEKGIMFISAVDLFSGVPVDVYRFDNIHYSKQGNAILLNAVAEKIGVNADGDTVFFSVSDKQVAQPRFNPCSATYQFSGASAPPVFVTADFSGQQRAIGVLTYVNGSRIRLELNYSASMYQTISISQRAAASAPIRIEPSVVSVGGGFAEIDLVGANGAGITQAQWDNVANTSAFSFFVSVS
ncbi:MAG: GDSL-type esterase/lipase family protein [Shewanella sp.]